MCPGYLTRVLRKKLLGAAVVLFVLLYCFLRLAYQSSSRNGLDDRDTVPLRNLESFLWHTADEEETNATNGLVTCRNSVQGKLLMVDDRGYVCSRFNILASGCCDKTSSSVVRYSCNTCNANGCCSIYEYCISCCLNPDKKELMQAVLHRALVACETVFVSVSDHYELCLAKCRTSSRSVHHENSYRDPSAKHCYTDNHPPPDSHSA